MTIVFSAVSPLRFILMSVDSAITLEFTDQEKPEYQEGTKLFLFPRVACVGLWGAMDGNRVYEFLRGRNISPSAHSVVDVANLVNEYLTKEYKPHELGVGEVGYHVAGHDREGRPHLYHIFYAFDRPTPADQTEPRYGCNFHVDPRDELHMLYGGRNDLAHMVVTKLLDEIRKGGDVRYDVRTGVGLARFGDFVVRFGGEMTPQVGPPFRTNIIAPNNRMTEFVNRSFHPLPQGNIEDGFRRLGYEVQAAADG